MRRLVLLCALALTACGDNLPPLPADDDPAHDAGVPDASGELAPCLDRPTDLARPPTGQLPCDLLPPGFGS